MLFCVNENWNACNVFEKSYGKNVTIIALQTAASSIIMIITFLQEESRSSEQFFKQLAPFAAVVHP